MDALAAEPAMSLTFKATVPTHYYSQKADTPELPDLARVLDFQRRLRHAGSQSAKRLEQCKDKIDKGAVQERHRRGATEKQLLAATLKELEKRTGRRGVTKRPLKRPSSVPPPAEASIAPLLFKPIRRVRAKSSPALLAILQAPDSLPAKSRQEIVNRACAWQGIPQPGTPRASFALQELPAFSSPGGPAPRTPRGTGAARPCASPLAPMGVGSGSPLRVQALSPHRRPCSSPPPFSNSPGLATTGSYPSRQVERTTSLAASPRRRPAWPNASPTPKGVPMAFSPACSPQYEDFAARLLQSP